MTSMHRICISLTKELEQQLADLRKTDKYCRMSWAGIIRQMIASGIENERTKEAQA